MPDFVGWPGLAPITVLIEHLIGLEIAAPARLERWDLRSPARTGSERPWLTGSTLDLVAEAADATACARRGW
jgi:hypothetical protein